MQTESYKRNAGIIPDRFDDLGTIQPTIEWTRSVTDVMMSTAQRKPGMVYSKMLIPVLLFIIVNGLLLVSIISPVNEKESSRERNFRQMQEELFIHNGPLN